MRKARGGFTLIEVLVVLVIASIVMAVLVSVLGSSFEILRSGENKAKLNANARTLLDYLTDDISTAAYIPLASDRDLNGWPDESDPDTGLGYGGEAVWRVSKLENDIPVVHSSFWLSEAWGDRLMTRHFNSAFGEFTLGSESRSVPKVISQAGSTRAAQWISLYRLAVPASTQMPYYLSVESDRNNDGNIDPLNTGSSGGVIQGYPGVVAVGPHKETAVALQDIWYAFENDKEFRRVRQIPISSNITRIRFEYFHEVPVYQSRAAGNQLEIAYQNLTDGSIEWEAPSDVRPGTDLVPMLSHWEQRIVDVAYNGSNNGGGFWQDGPTGAEYGTTHYRLQDQYPEGYNDAKRTGSHVAPNTGFGLGTMGGGGDSGWNCTVFYNIDSSGDDIGDNAPVDRLAFVTTGMSGGQAVEGGIAALRPDMEALHGSAYYQYSLDPTSIGDFGDADGIPDGDGQPDDPIPGWWLPYVRNIRVTVVATPTAILEQRTARSGQDGKLGTPVYYRLDSPVPFADPDRTIPLYNQKQDYIGPGADLVLTKTVPVDFAYRLELITDPRAAVIANLGQRRVELNYSNATNKLIADPVAFDTQVIADDPVEKMYEKDPSLLP